MKFTSATVLLGAAALVSAQYPDTSADLPQCGLICIVNAIQSATTCSPFDTACTCTSANQAKITAASTSCVQTTCTQAEQIKTLLVAGNICAKQNGTPESASVNLAAASSQFLASSSAPAASSAAAAATTSSSHAASSSSAAAVAATSASSSKAATTTSSAAAAATSSAAMTMTTSAAAVMSSSSAAPFSLTGAQITTFTGGAAYATALPIGGVAAGIAAFLAL